MIKRTIILKMELDGDTWEDYNDTDLNLILEDTGVLDNLKTGVYVEVIGEAEQTLNKEENGY